MGRSAVAAAVAKLPLSLFAAADAIAKVSIREKVGTKPIDRANKTGAQSIQDECTGFGGNQHGWDDIDKGETAADKALVVLVEFGEPWRGQAGPLHGEIPPPGPADNSTFWPGDFSADHNRQMLFGDSLPIDAADGSLRGVSTDTYRKHYLEQQHARCTADGFVADWVKVPYQESCYGKDSGRDTDSANGPVGRVVVNAITALATHEPDFPLHTCDREVP